MTVTSKDNRLVREWRGLCRESHLRQKAGRFAIEGARLCGDALASGLALQTVLYTPQAQQTYAGTVAALTAACPSSAEITPELARYMADTDHPQGVFCTANFLDNRLSLDTIKRMGRYGILEDMQDPGNLGTVIRTAEALGLDGLILSAGCCDIYNPKVLRGSMGGVFRLPLWALPRTAALPELIRQLQQMGMSACACVVDPAAEPVHTAGLGAGTLCVIGNEGNGLQPETAAACSRQVTIRMAGRAESLNASMAAGIVMWEMTRPQ